VLVLADRPCNAIAFAADEGIQTLLVDPSLFDERALWDMAVARSLEASEVDLVVMAGFLRWLGTPVLDKYPGRILNVHPSLLPLFPGLHSIRDALDAGVRVTGVTVHEVDETRDGGPIIAQEAVQLLPGDDEDALLARVHAVEHRVLPRAVAERLAALGGVELPPPRRASALSSSQPAGLPERCARRGWTSQMSRT
jgi:phosphoribosylglycinamide formyltransferase-1